jgi:hypothetical protein
VAPADDDRGPEPGESPKQRHDRELIELLNELRVALPGVQVLFAFLLVLPFSNGYSRVTAFQKDVFFVAFLAAALSSAFLIAPSSFHRLRWRTADKGYIVVVSNRLLIAGLLFLAIATIAVVLLIADFLFGSTAAVAATTVVGAVLVILWYGLALWSRVRES